MGYEIIDVSGDIGIRAEGKGMEELFVSAAKGLFALITDPESIKPERTLKIELKSDTLESLLISFLNELIFQFDTYGFLAKNILLESNINTGDTRVSGGFWLRAILDGEEFDPERHEKRLLVKAATYHNLKFYKVGDLWRADIIFDI